MSSFSLHRDGLLRVLHAGTELAVLIGFVAGLTHFTRECCKYVGKDLGMTYAQWEKRNAKK